MAEDEESALLAECEMDQQMEMEALLSIFADDIELVESNAEEGWEKSMIITCKVEVNEGQVLDVFLTGNGEKEGGGGGGVESKRDGKSEGMQAPGVRGIQYLPPLLLRVAFVPMYPRVDPPRFQLSCSWLDAKDLLACCKYLEGLWWDTYAGTPVVYTWVEWIQSSMLEYLGIRSSFTLGSDQQVGDPRVRVLWSDPGEALMNILLFHRKKEAEIFMKSSHLCHVCFEDKEGTEFMRLNCSHCFCNDCLNTYCGMLIDEGALNRLCCPNTQCNIELPPDTIKVIVGSEKFERWERLMLQKTLDGMQDLCYCPRCENPVIEERNHLGECTKCFMQFCTLCQDKYHPGILCMSAEEKIAVLQERVKRDPAAGEAIKEKVAQIKRLAEESVSLKVIHACSKPCPKCGMAISKIEGCNKMRCTRCFAYFCYACLKDISVEGYDHFGSDSCVLFDREAIEAWNRAQRIDQHAQAHLNRELFQQARAGAIKFVKCGNCNARMPKWDRNNHIQCEFCRKRFCGLCGKVVKNTVEHFGAGGCPQHS